MTWLIASAIGAAGLFFGLWQRSRAKRFEREWKLAQEAYTRELALHADNVSRYMRLVASLKAEVRRAQEAALANATPDELRARLSDLLRPHNS